MKETAVEPDGCVRELEVRQQPLGPLSLPRNEFGLQKSPVPEQRH